MTAAAYNELIKPMSLGEKAQLAREIVVTYARARWAIRKNQLPAAVNAMRTRYGDRESRYADALAEKYAAVRLGRAVGRTLSVLPWDSKCLVQSLVLAELLARRGVPCRVVIGVNPGPDFSAHAWVEASDGDPLLEPLAHVHNRLVEI